MIVWVDPSVLRTPSQSLGTFRGPVFTTQSEIRVDQILCFGTSRGDMKTIITPSLVDTVDFFR